MKSILIILICVFLVVNNIKSQTSNDEPTNFKPITYTPTSPDVAALGRYGMQPPDYSKGLPQVSIPLYELKENGLSFPINLYYNYSGFRPKEEASWVGMGWTISADAIITRIIKDAPDEAGYLYKKFEDYDQSKILSEYEQYIDTREGYENKAFNLTANRLLRQLEDGKPDMYIYNFNGHCGRFIYINNKAYTYPYNDLDIRKNDGQFIIKTPDGIQYTFEESDLSYDWGLTTTPLTYSYLNVPFISAWRLKRIDNSTTKAWIEFYYTDYSKVDVRFEIAQSVTFYSDNSSLDDNQTLKLGGEEPWGFTTSRFESRFINRIESNNTIIKFIPIDRIDFPENKALSQIEIYFRNQPDIPVKTFVLHPTYFGNTSAKETCWLRLDKVDEIPVSGKPLRYELFYESIRENVDLLGGKNGYGIDHWGYANGHSTNQSLIPEISEIASDEPPSGWLFNRWANRSSNYENAKLGSLNKIFYPTGGYTEFTYESAGGRGIRLKYMMENNGQSSLFKYYTYYPNDPITPPAYNFYKSQDLFVNHFGHYDPEGSCGHIEEFVSARRYLTITATSKSSLDFFDEITNYYSRVTESVGSGGKTEYEFQKDGVSNMVFLKKKSDFAYGNPVPVRSEENIYDVREMSIINYYTEPIEIYKGVGINCPSAYDWYYFSSPPFDPYPSYPSYYLGEVYVGWGALRQIWFKKTKSIINTDGVTEEETYSYHTDLPPRHLYPLKIEKISSSSDLLKTELFHPGDFSVDNGIREMWDKMDANFKNLISPVVKMKKYVNGNLIYSANNTYSFENNMILLKSLNEYPVGNEETVNHWFYNYDDFGNIIENSKESDITYSYIWNYNKAYPVVKAVNISHSALENSFNAAVSSSGITDYSELTNPSLDDSQKAKFNNFNDGLRQNLPSNVMVTTYTFDPLIGMTSQTNPNGISSFYEYDDFKRLKYIKDSEENILKSYEYSFYNSSGNNPSLFYSAETFGHYTRNDCDEADFFGQTGTYRVPTGRYTSMFSQLDADQKADADVSANGQNYINALCKCKPLVYNKEISQVFTKNDCGSGYIGTEVIYTVPANTYSATSQELANQKAQDEINANGQAYANTHGTCVIICYNIEMSKTFTKEGCGFGYEASQVPYVVPAGRYSSTISQADANNKALNEIHQNGQQNANNIGSCTLIPAVSVYINDTHGYETNITFSNNGKSKTFTFHAGTTSGIMNIPPGNYAVTISLGGCDNSIQRTFTVGSSSQICTCCFVQLSASITSGITISIEE